MLSRHARPSVCQMPSSVHTGSRWLVVSIVEFHAHVTVQRWYETSKDGTKSPWYEGYEKSMVQNVHGTKSPPMVRNVYGTNSLWYEKSASLSFHLPKLNPAILVALKDDYWDYCSDFAVHPSVDLGCD